MTSAPIEASTEPQAGAAMIRASGRTLTPARGRLSAAIGQTVGTFLLVIPPNGTILWLMSGCRARAAPGASLLTKSKASP